ncbi:DNA repair photolyase [Archaeoglobus sulfaticallidus PM70-1]|uniref:DNA repair photolyase n=1 Tax=Archaeoglobus sulfaticallidus PM70-1 TaxID=387631 RepID=N0BFA8_9EURY|nr:radical SAM protein [Archaeoglobus sulfaticallidus]AGK61708.1 DNA repair photolyase [Archaeoglobus sulfaticallidus PM70-1]
MVKDVFVKTALNKHRKRDAWFLDDYSLNPYQLCEFNCVYCYIRGSKYGENTKHGLAVKINAPTLLEKELYKRARKKEYGFIALSSATEPWMYIEEKYKVTRKCLEVIARFKFPVHCLTKSPLILRDVDLLDEIDKHAVLPEDLKNKLNRGVLITVSLSTLDESVAKVFEPNSPKPRERLNALKELIDNGFYAGIAFMPVLPFISDSNEELEEMVKTARELDVRHVYFSPLTMHDAGRELYFKVLEKYFPDLVEKYEAIYKKWYPEKTYSDQFFRRIINLCKKYNVKLGGK